ncbi:hypothetical protein PENSPDRAFT_659418 [Peniophora sp. CONT]|nr:hypothetical protein PENSPDRAFT_659418 [Peniophora sp. CONT]
MPRKRKKLLLLPERITMCERLASRCANAVYDVWRWRWRRAKEQAEQAEGANLVEVTAWVTSIS